MAAVVVAFPLVYRTVKAGFEGVEADLEDAARAQERVNCRYCVMSHCPLQVGHSLLGMF